MRSRLRTLVHYVSQLRSNSRGTILAILPIIMTTTTTTEDTLTTLHDSDTSDTVTAEQLGITQDEYDALCEESQNSDQPEGHVRTSTGRRVYATE